MGKFERLRERQKRQRERRETWRDRVAAATLDARAARRYFVQIRARIRRMRERGEKVPPELWEERKRRRELWLEAELQRDASRDRLKAIQANINRTRKQLMRIRRRRQRPDVKVLTRSEWGANGPRGGYSRNSSLWGVIDHHTAQARGTYRSLGDVAARMRAYQRLHHSHGWTDIGYHAVTFLMADGSAVVCEGRPRWAVGAHTQGRNTGTVGNCADGYYHPPVDDAAPAVVLAAMKHARTEVLKAGGVKVSGHRDHNPTACPGNRLYPKIGQT